MKLCIHSEDFEKTTKCGLSHTHMSHQGVENKNTFYYVRFDNLRKNKNMCINSLKKAEKHFLNDFIGHLVLAPNL